MENFNPEIVANNLNTKIVGRNILYFPSVTSTNDIAKEKARLKAPEGTVIIAGEQTAGKGRLGRVWTSPKGTLAYSVVLYPSIKQLPFLIMIASVSVVRAIKSITGIASEIKWPNDVLINGKKVCGILIENSLRGNKVDYSVIGIGLNVSTNLKDNPELSNAANLVEESGHGVDSPSLICRLLTEIDNLYVGLSDGRAVFHEWRDNLVTLGRQVRAVSGDVVYEGIAESLGFDGSLFIRQKDGKLVQVTQGDVTLRG